MRILQVQGAGRGLDVAGAVKKRNFILPDLFFINCILPDLISSGQLELEEETVCVNGDEIP